MFAAGYIRKEGTKGGVGYLEEVANHHGVRHHHKSLWTERQLVNSAALYEPERQSSNRHAVCMLLRRGPFVRAEIPLKGETPLYAAVVDPLISLLKVRYSPSIIAFSDPGPKDHKILQCIPT